MIVCEYCGRTFRASMPKPIRCLCNKEAVREGPYPKKKNDFSFLHNKEEEGRKHWGLLHAYPKQNKDKWDIQEAKLWYYKWESNIPKVNCSCRRDWFDITLILKPDFSSAEAFFKWSVAGHNKVNAKLGKPLVSYEEARKIHGF